MTISEKRVEAQRLAEVLVTTWLPWSKKFNVTGRLENKTEFHSELTLAVARNELPPIAAEFFPKRVLYTLASNDQRGTPLTSPTTNPTGNLFWFEVFCLLKAKPENQSWNNAEKQSMNNTTPFETISFAFGKDVNKMSDDELIVAAKNCDERINAIVSLEGQSTKIDSKIAELKTAKQAILRVLDNRA